MTHEYITGIWHDYLDNMTAKITGGSERRTRLLRCLEEIPEQPTKDDAPVAVEVMNDILSTPLALVLRAWRATTGDMLLYVDEYDNVDPKTARETTLTGTPDVRFVFFPESEQEATVTTEDDMLCIRHEDATSEDEYVLPPAVMSGYTWNGDKWERGCIRGDEEGWTLNGEPLTSARVILEG